MSNKKIEDVISNVLTGDAQKNALNLVSHIRTIGGSEYFAIKMHDEKDESGWVADDLGFIFVNGSADFPGPWTLWLSAGDLGQHAQNPVDDAIKEIVWQHVSPCGSCGGKCAPGVGAKVLGKDFTNTCQGNLMFVDPNADVVELIKKIVEIRLCDIRKNG